MVGEEATSNIEQKSILTPEERADIKFILNNLKVAVYYGLEQDKKLREIVKLLEDNNRKFDALIRSVESLQKR